jgi:hypothetical protein
MNCKHLYKDIIGYAEHTISSDLNKKIEQHLSECSSCEKIYQEVLKTYEVFDHCPTPEVNPYFYTRVEQKLKALRDREIFSVYGLVWKIKPVAATVLIVAGISMGVFIGKNISGSNSSTNNNDRKEILEAYATDYYLTGTSDESTYVLVTNE